MFYKGLDLTDRVPEELWMEVHDIVQEAVIKTIPKKKKCKKAKWLTEGALQITVNRREVKMKGERKDTFVFRVGSTVIGFGKLGRLTSPKPFPCLYSFWHFV